MQRVQNKCSLAAAEQGSRCGVKQTKPNISKEGCGPLRVSKARALFLVQPGLFPQCLPDALASKGTRILLACRHDPVLAAAEVALHIEKTVLDTGEPALPLRAALSGTGCMASMKCSRGN